MKRSSLRRTAMKPRAVPLRRTEFRRRPSELGLRKPGRPTVSQEERLARKLVYARSGGWCEARGDAPATEWHHRKNRSQGGKWAASNGLHVCRLCHAWITEHPPDAGLKGWTVRSMLDPAIVGLYYRGELVALADDGSVLTGRPPESAVAS